MMFDISLIFSDGAIPEDPRLLLMVNRNSLAVDWSVHPEKVDETDAITYQIGILSMGAREIARQRAEAQRGAKGAMNLW